MDRKGGRKEEKSWEDDNGVVNTTIGKPIVNKETDKIMDEMSSKERKKKHSSTKKRTARDLSKIV